MLGQVMFSEFLPCDSHGNRNLIFIFSFVQGEQNFLIPLLYFFSVRLDAWKL